MASYIGTNVFRPSIHAIYPEEAMNSSDIIIEVTEANFQYEVLQYSRNKPVIVDFWAEWCAPCKMLGPLLEHLVESANGIYRLAKVNVDENQNLSLRYSVRSIPTVKGFRLGGVVNEFVGLIPEDRIRDFMKELAPSTLDLTLNRAENFLQAQRWEEAEANFRKITRQPNTSPEALLGLAKSLIATNKAEEAQQILTNFPGGKEYAAAEQLLPLANVLLAAPSNEPASPTDATFQRAVRLIQLGNYEAAMDGLLDVLRVDKRYKKGRATKVMRGIFELLGPESKLTRQYQREMAMVLF